jgi:hypothetical protein
VPQAAPALAAAAGAAPLSACSAATWLLLGATAFCLPVPRAAPALAAAAPLSAGATEQLPLPGASSECSRSPHARQTQRHAAIVNDHTCINMQHQQPPRSTHQWEVVAHARMLLPWCSEHITCTAVAHKQYMCNQQHSWDSRA